MCSMFGNVIEKTAVPQTDQYINLDHGCGRWLPGISAEGSA
jgi:hypothetical protein